MSHSIKLVLVIISAAGALRGNYGQDKSALKYIDEVNFKVEINYLSGNEEDYKWLLLYRSGIIAEALILIDSANIQINKDIETPNLILKVTADNNFKNKPPTEDGWYYINAEIYLIDKVKLIEHPGNKVETIIWQGDWIRTFISAQNVEIIKDEKIAAIVRSFIDDYLDVNSQ